MALNKYKVFLTDIYEASGDTAMQKLANYLHRPNIFVSFVDIEKLGINPSSIHTSTPLGIYAYPLVEAYAMMENKSVRFAGGRKYICLFEGLGNILDLQAYTHDDFTTDVENLAELWEFIDPDNEEFAMNMLVHWEEDLYNYDARPGMALWKIVARIADRAERHYNRESMVISNSIFRRLGYDGIVDHGGGIIHVNEPAQAVFFSKSACRTIDMMINNHLGGHTPAFNYRGERKIRGAKPVIDQEE